MTDFFIDEYEDAMNMLVEHIACSCGKAAEWDCATCLDDLCEHCAESHILGGHEVGRMEP